MSKKALAAAAVEPEPVPEAMATGLSKGRDTIDYNEYPPFAENLISDAFIEEMVGQFNNDDPDSAFRDETWHIFGKSKPEPKDHIKFIMAKRQKEGFPTIEIMGYAEFEGVTAAACWETMENHHIRKEWDGNMAEFRTIELCGKRPPKATSGSWHEVCYSRTKFPFPLSARDCVYSKYISLDFEKGIFFCVWRPCEHPDVPKTKKVTRSWSYGAQFMFQLPGNKMRVWQAGCGDPKGHIPAWLINIALPKLAVAGVRDLRSKAEETQKMLAAAASAAAADGGAGADGAGGGGDKKVEEPTEADGAAAPALPMADAADPSS